MAGILGRIGSGVAICGLLAAVPAQAQFGGLGSMLSGASKPKPQNNSNACPSGKKKSAGAAIFGAVAGAAANRVAGGLSSWVPIPDVANALTNAIACRLDPEEQKQAAEATLAATRGDEKTGDVAVGSTTEWTSKTRENVTGKSTVVAALDEPAKGMPTGSKCVTVTDVIIVNGEETTANKRMCRAPGAARYSLMA